MNDTKQHVTIVMTQVTIRQCTWYIHYVTHDSSNQSRVLIFSSGCKCPCERVKNQVIIHDTKELELKIADLKKDLEIKKSTVLSSQLRKRTSANDDRVSAKTVGAILGPLLIAMILGLIVISDLPILLNHLRNGPFAAVGKREKKVTKKNHKNMTADACA